MFPMTEENEEYKFQPQPAVSPSAASRHHQHPTPPPHKHLKAYILHDDSPGGSCLKHLFVKFKVI